MSKFSYQLDLDPTDPTGYILKKTWTNYEGDLSYEEMVDHVSDLPSTDNVGTGRFVRDDFNLWVFNEKKEWVEYFSSEICDLEDIPPEVIKVNGKMYEKIYRRKE